MVLCVVKHCRNDTSLQTTTNKFYRIPKDTEQRTKWLKICGWEKIVASSVDKHYVCSEHFADCDFQVKTVLEGPDQDGKIHSTKMKTDKLKPNVTPSFKLPKVAVVVPSKIELNSKLQSDTSLQDEERKDKSDIQVPFDFVFLPEGPAVDLDAETNKIKEKQKNYLKPIYDDCIQLMTALHSYEVNMIHAESHIVKLANTYFKATNYEESTNKATDEHFKFLISSWQAYFKVKQTITNINSLLMCLFQKLHFVYENFYKKQEQSKNALSDCNTHIEKLKNNTDSVLSLNKDLFEQNIIETSGVFKTYEKQTFNQITSCQELIKKINSKIVLLISYMTHEVIQNSSEQKSKIVSIPSNVKLKPLIVKHSSLLSNSVEQSTKGKRKIDSIIIKETSQDKRQKISIKSIEAPANTIAAEKIKNESLGTKVMLSKESLDVIRKKLEAGCSFCVLKTGKVDLKLTKEQFYKMFPEQKASTNINAKMKKSPEQL